MEVLNRGIATAPLVCPETGVMTAKIFGFEFRVMVLPGMRPDSFAMIGVDQFGKPQGTIAENVGGGEQ